MKTRRPSSWIAMTGLALALASALTFLYVRTQAHDAAFYFEDVAVLRQIKQLDSRWELDVLKTRMSVDTNYDALVDPPVEINRLWDQLQSAAADQRRNAKQAWAGLDEEFHREIAQKTRLIEHFKSHNSVLRNSLVFLPTAAADVESAMLLAVGHGAAQRQFADGVNEVLLSSIVFSQAPSDERGSEIQSGLMRLAGNPERLPENVREPLEIFASHVRTVLREQPEVNGLLSGISLVPTAERIDALDNQMSGEQRDNESKAQGYRQYLLLFATALAAFLIYAASSVIRSHSVIQRVNKELQGSNATLELRVEERTAELHQAQTELMTTARQAGMAEIANNVLHNVGNVLNSVNVSAVLIGNRMRDSKDAGFARAVELMNQHATDLGGFFTRDEKGRALPGYLNKLVATLAAEKHGIVQELASLVSSVDHIKRIVATQQSYSGSTSVVEAVQIGEVIDDALRMNAASILRHQITVTKHFAQVPSLLLDKHRVLQILVNLIANAQQAVAAVANRARQITLHIDLALRAGNEHLRIRVEDDGEGIRPENLGLLFAHGFTTRANGHGFGLHSCALAAKLMGGAIIAHSDGADRGAVFTLELPFNPAPGLR